MSLARIFDANLTVTPGADGSFIVYTGEMAQKRGFTNIGDLLSFLQRAAKAREPEAVDVLEVAKVVETSVKPWPVFETAGDTRRTTAAGSLAERIAQSVGVTPPPLTDPKPAA